MQRLDAEWVDILPPELAAGGALPFPLALGLGLLLGAALAFGFFHYRHPRQRARRALRRLARELARDAIKPKPACFALKRALVAGLGAPLEQVSPPATDAARWAAYRAQLIRDCYAPGAPPPDLLAQRIDEALRWLARTGGRR